MCNHASRKEPIELAAESLIDLTPEAERIQYKYRSLADIHKLFLQYHSFHHITFSSLPELSIQLSSINSVFSNRTAVTRFHNGRLHRPQDPPPNSQTPLLRVLPPARRLLPLFQPKQRPTTLRPATSSIHSSLPQHWRRNQLRRRPAHPPLHLRVCILSLRPTRAKKGVDDFSDCDGIDPSVGRTGHVTGHQAAARNYLL